MLQYGLGRPSTTLAAVSAKWTSSAHSGGSTLWITLSTRNLRRWPADRARSLWPSIALDPWAGVSERGVGSCCAKGSARATSAARLRRGLRTSSSTRRTSPRLRCKVRQHFGFFGTELDSLRYSGLRIGFNRRVEGNRSPGERGKNAVCSATAGATG